MMGDEQKKGFLNIPKAVWWQLAFLGLGYAIYSANRLSFGVGLKAMGKQLSLTVMQVGILSTIFTLGQALIDIPAGFLADKLGRKKLLLMGMAGIGVTTMAVTAVGNFVSAVVMRFLFGTFEGMWNIVMYSVAGSIVPGSRGMLNGLMMSFYSVGCYVGPAYYGWTLDKMPGNWQFGLMTMGGAALAFALLLAWGLKASDTDKSTQIKTMHITEAVREVGTNKGVWLGVAVQVLNVIPYWGFAAMGPYLMMTFKGFSASYAGQFFGAVYGIGGLSAVFLGYLADKYGRRPLIIAMSLSIVVCGYLIFHVIPSTSLVLLYIVGGLMGIGLHANYVMGYTVGQDAVEERQVGLATGFVGACMYFTSFFSGPGMSYVTKQLGAMAALDIIVLGFEAALLVLALFMPETMKKPAAVAEVKGEAAAK